MFRLHPGCDQRKNEFRVRACGSLWGITQSFSGVLVNSRDPQPIVQSGWVYKGHLALGKALRGWRSACNSKKVIQRIKRSTRYSMHPHLLMIGLDGEGELYVCDKLRCLLV